MSTEEVKGDEKFNAEKEIKNLKEKMFWNDRTLDIQNKIINVLSAGIYHLTMKVDPEFKKQEEERKNKKKKEEEEEKEEEKEKERLREEILQKIEYVTNKLKDIKERYDVKDDYRGDRHHTSCNGDCDSDSE
jgi:hypothetical protein